MIYYCIIFFAFQATFFFFIINFINSRARCNLGLNSEEWVPSRACDCLIEIDFSSSYKSTYAVLFVDIVCSCACISSISRNENVMINGALVSLEWISYILSSEFRLCWVMVNFVFLLVFLLAKCDREEAAGRRICWHFGYFSSNHYPEKYPIIPRGYF